MQGNNKKSIFRMAAFCVAAFVFCVAFTGATQSAAGFADKKAYAKGYRAVRKGDYEQAEKIFRELLTYMMENPRNIFRCTRAQSIAKYLERIADHTTNLAELVVFMTRGHDIRHPKSRAERTRSGKPPPVESK
jgi:hypothetical protein